MLLIKNIVNIYNILIYFIFIMKKVSKAKPSEKVEKKKKFQIFIWNSQIHNTFLGLLVICVLLLFSALILQGMYVDVLEYKLKNENPRSEALNYERDVMLGEVYLEKTGLESLNIAEMLIYYQKHNYENIYYNTGYIEATMDQCGDDGCKRVTYKFNQNKGLYIDVIQKRLE